MILVPLNKKFFAASGFSDVALKFSKCRDSFEAGTLDTGTDSPGIGVSKTSYPLPCKIYL